MSATQELSKRRINPETAGKSTDSIVSNQNKQLESTSLLQSIISGYKSSTSAECKSIDTFLFFTMMTGVAQMIYCVLTKGYPYNAFIGVFSASVGSFVFAGKPKITRRLIFTSFFKANARLQLSKKASLSKVEKVHLIIEFLVCSILLNVFVANFIG